MMDKSFIDRVTEKMDQTLEIYLSKENEGKFPVEFKVLGNSKFFYYVRINIDELLESEYYIVKVFNPFSTEVEFNVDLIDGGYRLVNLN